MCRPIPNMRADRPKPIGKTPNKRTQKVIRCHAENGAKPYHTNATLGPTAPRPRQHQSAAAAPAQCALTAPQLPNNTTGDPCFTSTGDFQSRKTSVPQAKRGPAMQHRQHRTTAAPAPLHSTRASIKRHTRADTAEPHHSDLCFTSTATSKVDFQPNFLAIQIRR